MLAKYHANGSMDDPFVLKEMEEIEEAIDREKINRQGFRSFLSTPGNRHRLLIICVVACGSQVSSLRALESSYGSLLLADFIAFTQTNGVSLFSYYLTPVLNTIGVTAAKDQTMGSFKERLLERLIGQRLTFDTSLRNDS